MDLGVYSDSKGAKKQKGMIVTIILRNKLLLLRSDISE